MSMMPRIFTPADLRLRNKEELKVFFYRMRSRMC
jgi:hypothetical protein